jgi:hypothetical protein
LSLVSISGSLKVLVRELSNYTLDIIGVHEVREQKHEVPFLSPNCPYINKCLNSNTVLTIILLLYRAFLITFKFDHTPHSTEYTDYSLKHILPHSNIFNDVFLLIIPQIL